MKRYAAIVLALLVCAEASAQNLNPTVQVENAYEGKLLDVQKKNVPMAVPDSLLKFDWDFNYSVFDNPYRGAYEFSPYLIDMKPEASVYDGKSLYVRAGAGYSLHPEATVVWTPKLGNRFSLDLHDDFTGYWGRYHEIGALSSGSGYKIENTGDTYKGSDFGNRAGFTLRYTSSPVIVSMDGEVDFLKASASGVNENKALGTSLAFRARSNVPSALSYDAALKLSEFSNRPQYESGSLRYSEEGLGVSAKLAYAFSEAHALELDAVYEHYNFSEKIASTSYPGLLKTDRVDVAPAYRLSLDRFNVAAGIRYSDVGSAAKAVVGYDVFGSDVQYDAADYKGRKLYPNVRLSYEAVEETLVLSAYARGGQKFNSYGTYLEGNHHFSRDMSSVYSTYLGDATVNTFDIGAGASGKVRSKLQYKLEAGYARYYNVPLEGIMHLVNSFVPVYSMDNCDALYADLSASWTTDRLEASAAMKLQQVTLDPDRVSYALTLPAFSGSAGFTYNWNKRMYAGLSAGWATPRKGKGYMSYGNSFECSVPGWVDLGMNLEYRVNSFLSVWIEGRNLLNQTVMRNFWYAEKGPWGSLGVSLNF